MNKVSSLGTALVLIIVLNSYGNTKLVSLDYCMYLRGRNTLKIKCSTCFPHTEQYIHCDKYLHSKTFQVKNFR